MNPLYLDTHAVVWLYEKKLEKFSARALAMLEHAQLRISPMVMLELGYLFEIGKITVPALPIIDQLQARIDLFVCTVPFGEISRYAIAENWTRDPFDRLITAQARFADALLLTKDRAILEHYGRAFWE